MINYLITVFTGVDTYKLFKNDKDEFLIEFKQHDNGTHKEPTESWSHVLKSDNYHGAIKEFFDTVTHDVQHFAQDL